MRLAHVHVHVPPADPCLVRCFGVGAQHVGVDATPFEVKLGEWGGAIWQPIAYKLAPKGESSAKKPKAGPELVGAYINVYWPLDEAWYAAKVVKWDGEKLKHKVRYVIDDVQESLDLNAEEWRHAMPAAGGAPPEPVLKRVKLREGEPNRLRIKMNHRDREAQLVMSQLNLPLPPGFGPVDT